MKLIFVLSLSLLLVGSAMSSFEEVEVGVDKCSLCKLALENLNPILIPKLKGLIKDLLNTACKVVPIPLCSSITGKIAGYVTGYLRKFLEHDRLCKFVGVCEKESLGYYSADDFDLSDEKTACVKCQLLVNKAKQVVADKKELLNLVVMDMMQDCETEELDLPKDVCTDLVESFAVKLVDTAIAEFPEFQACSAYEMC